MPLEQEVREVFAQGGVLSQAADQFREREGQTQMALAVARTIAVSYTHLTLPTTERV